MNLKNDENEGRIKYFRLKWKEAWCDVDYIV